MTLGKFRLAAGFTALLLAVAALVSPAAASGKPIVRVRGSSVAESAGYATVTLRVRKKARSRIKVRFRTVSGTAVAGRDFVAASGHVTIRKHKRSATIRLRILDDAVHEGTEYFYVKLASKASTLKPRRVAVVIGDDDPPPSSGTTLTGTVSYQLVHDEYFGDLELGSPGEEHWTTTLTLHVSLHQLGDGEWYDDGTGYWSFVSENKLWFRRGEGVDTAENGYPFGCADDPAATHFYRQLWWYGTDGNNKGPLMVPGAFAPPLHQAYLGLTGYHPDGTGTPVLKAVAHVRPDRIESRLADGGHVCDPSTAEQPNPIVYQGDDPHLAFYDTDSYEALIPGGADGLAATYEGSSLNFADGAIQESHSGLFNDTTGHWAHENTDHYTVGGTLTLQ